MYTFNPTEKERFALYDVIEKGARKDERKKFVEEKKELERDLRKKWKRLGYRVYIEKKNHIKSLNDTYQGYLMAIHIWKMYRVDYYSKRSGRS